VLPSRSPLLRPLRALVALAAVVTVSLLAACGAIGAPAGGAGVADPTVFHPGAPYTGKFAAGAVLQEGGTYYMVGTTVAHLNLPVMTSTDLQHWYARPAIPDYADFGGGPSYNEAMLTKPAWAWQVATRGTVPVMSQWAPSIAHIGEQYVVAFSAATADDTAGDRDSCIGLATSVDPLGPYAPQDAPLTCNPESRTGAIDPDFFTDPRTGQQYLLWKDNGSRGSRPPYLMMRELDATGTAWAPGSRPHPLITQTLPWEDNLVENASMFYARGRYVLLYSAGHYTTADYKIGYAVCTSPVGGCVKRRRPLLATSGRIAGPGTPDAFRDTAGRIRMAYSAWTRGLVGAASGRHTHIATLAIGRHGVVRLVDRGGA